MTSLNPVSQKLFKDHILKKWQININIRQLTATVLSMGTSIIPSKALGIYPSKALGIYPNHFLPSQYSTYFHHKTFSTSRMQILLP